MLSDREFLMWIHERLEHVHGDSGLLDYMHKLRAIIAATSAEQNSASSGTNSLEQLKKMLEVK